MKADILEQRMLEDTLETLQVKDFTEVTAAQGVMLIDGWLQALENDIHVESIQKALMQLREQLNNPSPEREEIKSLLSQLADEAAEVAQRTTSEGIWTGGLQSMSVLLRDYGNQL